MKAKYTGTTDFPYLTNGKTYDIIAVEKGPDVKKGGPDVDWYRVVTDVEEDYLFLPTDFEVVEE